MPRSFSPTVTSTSSSSDESSMILALAGTRWATTRLPLTMCVMIPRSASLSSSLKVFRASVVLRMRVGVMAALDART